MDKSIAQSLVPVETGHGFTGEQIEIIKNSVAKGVSDQELAYFLEVCRSTGLNPLHRQIYAIMRSGKMTIQTGIDGYRLLAHRSRRHVGTDDAVYDTETAAHPNKATVTVYKWVAGQRCAYTATARWKEYVQESSPMWNKMPYLMLAKVAESLALRKAFPAETSGLYTDEEMMQADRVDNSAPAQIAAPVITEVIEEAQTRLLEMTPEQIEDTIARAQATYPGNRTNALPEPTPIRKHKTERPEAPAKSIEQLEQELKARALGLGLTEEQYDKSREHHGTYAATEEALNVYEARQRHIQQAILTSDQRQKIRRMAAPLMLPDGELSEICAQHGNDFEQIMKDLGQLVDQAGVAASRRNH
jgi:phage recombination protein Bet